VPFVQYGADSPFVAQRGGKPPARGLLSPMLSAYARSLEQPGGIAFMQVAARCRFRR
jgi:hypothetical protein